MRTDERGFTVIEILIAIVVLSVGLLALAGSSAMVTRMVGRGKISTVAAHVAARRLERLRSLAASTASPCTAAGFATNMSGTSTPTDHVTERWVVGPSATPAARKVAVYVMYQTSPGNVRTDTVATMVPCLS